MNLQGENWIKQPAPQWVMVGFSGYFDAQKNSFSGKMQLENCGAIEFKKQEAGLANIEKFTSAPPASSAPAPAAVNNVTLKEIELSFKSNLFDETIKKARTFLEFEPNNKEAHAYLGVALLLKKEVDESISHLEKVIVLGDSMPFPVKRGKPNPLGLGHMLGDGELTIAKDKILLKDGDKIFQANLSDISETKLENYQNQCPYLYIKGFFVETRAKSEKTKQEMKDFWLFPTTATLQQVQQNNLTVNIIACKDEGILPTAMIKLLNRLRSAP
jgi:tetratricopeptide (TPR) repeat protein